LKLLLEEGPLCGFDFNSSKGVAYKKRIKFSHDAYAYLRSLTEKGLLHDSGYDKSESGHPVKKYYFTAEGMRHALLSVALSNAQLESLPGRWPEFKPGYIPSFILEKWPDFIRGGLGNLAAPALRDAIIGAPYHRLNPKPGTNPSITESETPSKAWEDFKKDRDASREASGKAQYEEEFIRLFLSHFENGMLSKEDLEGWLSFLKRHKDVRQRMVDYYRCKEIFNGDLANIAHTDGEILRLLERPDMELSKVVARAGSLVKSCRHYVP